jgi:hypothetical protein
MAGLVRAWLNRVAISQAVHPDPYFAQGPKDPSVWRNVIALIVKHFSDVDAVLISANLRTQPAILIVTDGITTHVETPHEGGDV